MPETYPAVCISIDSNGHRYFQSVDPQAPDWLKSGNHFVSPHRTSAKVGDKVTLKYTATNMGYLWLPNK